MKNILLTITALFITTAAFSAEGTKSSRHAHSHDMMMAMIQGFDTNEDETFSKEELTLAFEAIINKRVNKIKRSQDSGIVFTPVPEDLVNYLFSDFDSNGNESIELEEFAASKGAFKKFNLGLNSKQPVAKS